MLKSFGGDKRLFINKLNRRYWKKTKRSNIDLEKKYDDLFIGLKNFGNTCFIASIIQSLYSLKEVTIFLVKTFIELEDFFLDFEEYKLFKSYLELISFNFDYIKDQKKFVELWKNFYQSLHDSELKKTFEKGTQQDAHEFLLKFLTYLDECSLEAELVKRGFKNNETFSEVCDQLREESLFGQFFNFKYEQTCECENQHSHKRNVSDCNLILDVKKISDNHPVFEDLNTCLKEWFKYDFLACCKLCNQDLNHFNENKIINSNKFLIIQLKIFQFSEDRKFSKVNDFLKIPKLLDLGAKRYQVSAIVFHLGNDINSGHYTSLVWSIQSKKWKYFDDDKNVIEYEQNDTRECPIFDQNSQPYLIFYAEILGTNCSIKKKKNKTSKNGCFNIFCQSRVNRDCE